MKKIWGNTIVKNEGKFIWFALMSVVDQLDKILVYDTGSSDNTVELIKRVQHLKPGKIEFREIGEVDSKGLAKARQTMLDESKCDWIFLLDGDEVWWSQVLKEAISLINRKDLDSIANRYFSVIGDIYHYQEERAGRYNLAGRKGHLNIRFINRKIPGLHVEGSYPFESYSDENNIKIQDRDKILFLDKYYLHFSNIQRSDMKGDKKVMKRQRKIRSEIGLRFADDFKYPEVFFVPKPRMVSSPWQPMSTSFKLKASLETPFRKAKRLII
jgi:glycosyltransferase involved in cell wall biosynthesis